jgi:hypothetical protein
MIRRRVGSARAAKVLFSVLEYLTIWLTISDSFLMCKHFFFVAIYRIWLIAPAAAIIGHAQSASSTPKSNPSIANCRRFSLAKKSRANWRTSRPCIVRARLIFGTVRLIVIKRMCERTHLPVGRQVTNCQKRVTSR